MKNIDEFIPERAMYDPVIGRWTTEDPIDFKAGDPNLYRMVKNSPTNATDPSGLKILIYYNTMTDMGDRPEDKLPPEEWQVWKKKIYDLDKKLEKQLQTVIGHIKGDGIRKTIEKNIKSGKLVLNRAPNQKDWANLILSAISLPNSWKCWQDCKKRDMG